ncbi:hypothetical protein ACGRHY_17255 [Streptomyces sp. HK10]|uniref:hypothetical protein n=1 Tax=Streptomyces sp. HK10 TaxID=3373255 RepID=UPI0037497609
MTPTGPPRKEAEEKEAGELDTGVHPDGVQRDITEALIAAGDDLRFDMSGRAPAAFGGTEGEGEWKAR